MISVVVPTIGRNSLTLLIQSIRRALANEDLRLEHDVEIVVCFDSRVTKAQMEVSRSPDVRTVRAHCPGANGARNEGARLSRGTILWFLDDDTRLSSVSSFRVLREIFDDRAVIAAGGDYLTAPNARVSERGYNAFCSLWRTSAGEAGCEQLLGGTLAVRKSTWERIGFDEGIHYGGAETSFVKRLHEMATHAPGQNQRVLYHESLSVFHSPGVRATRRWIETAIMQSLRKNEISYPVPSVRRRTARSFEFLKAQDSRTLCSLGIFSIPFLTVSKYATWVKYRSMKDFGANATMTRSGFDR